MPLFQLLHVQTLETLEADVRAEAEVCRRNWEECEKGAKLVAARFLHQYLFELENTLDRLRIECPDEKRVLAALRLAHTRV